MPGQLEREIKLRFDNADAARAAVLSLGAIRVTARRRQVDALFDTVERHLGARGQVLRIRTEDGRSLLTLKSPVSHPTMKLREELETPVGDGALFAAILERLGLRIWFRYEKYREEFSLKGATIAVDETPVGTFIEIEGHDDAAVAAVARALGRGPGDYVLDSYRALFERHCLEHGIAVTDMLFSASKR